MVSRRGNDIFLGSNVLQSCKGFFSLLKKLFVDICCGNFRSRTFGRFNIIAPAVRYTQIAAANRAKYI